MSEQNKDGQNEQDTKREKETETPRPRTGPKSYHGFTSKPDKPWPKEAPKSYSPHNAPEKKW